MLNDWKAQLANTRKAAATLSGANPDDSGCQRRNLRDPVVAGDQNIQLDVERRLFHRDRFGFRGAWRDASSGLPYCPTHQSGYQCNPPHHHLESIAVDPVFKVPLRVPAFPAHDSGISLPRHCRHKNGSEEYSPGDVCHSPSVHLWQVSHHIWSKLSFVGNEHSTCASRRFMGRTQVSAPSRVLILACTFPCFTSTAFRSWWLPLSSVAVQISSDPGVSVSSSVFVMNLVCGTN